MFKVVLCIGFCLLQSSVIALYAQNESATQKFVSFINAIRQTKIYVHPTLLESLQKVSLETGDVYPGDSLTEKLFGEADYIFSN